MPHKIATGLSVVMSVYNAERHIKDAIASIKDLASEIIVIDHYSADGTISLAKRLGATVYQTPNRPDAIDRMKNEAIEKAHMPWVLVLDADERVSQSLASEIRNLLQSDPTDTAFRMPRQNIIFGKTLAHTGWYPDWQLRLVKKGKGTYLSDTVHVDMRVEGSIGTLEHPLIHEHYDSIMSFFSRALNLYAPAEAKERIKKGYQFSAFDCIRLPCNEFLSRFFAREGYKDGYHGLMLSLMMGVYHFFVACYMWEYARFPKEPQGYSLPALKNEYYTLFSHGLHWEGALDKSRSYVKKLVRWFKKNVARI